MSHTMFGRCILSTPNRTTSGCRLPLQVQPDLQALCGGRLAILQSAAAHVRVQPPLPKTVGPASALAERQGRRPRAGRQQCESQSIGAASSAAQVGRECAAVQQHGRRSAAAAPATDAAQSAVAAPATAACPAAVATVAAAAAAATPEHVSGASWPNAEAAVQPTFGHESGERHVLHGGFQRVTAVAADTVNGMDVLENYINHSEYLFFECARNIS